MAKAKVKVKVTPRKGKAVKARTSSNSGGVFTVKVAATVNKNKK